MVSACHAVFPEEIRADFETRPRAAGVLRDVIDPRPMKNDPTFKFVAAIILAGVVVALFSPSPSHADSTAPAGEITAPATSTPATE